MYIHTEPAYKRAQYRSLCIGAFVYFLPCPLSFLFVNDKFRFIETVAEVSAKTRHNWTEVCLMSVRQMRTDRYRRAKNTRAGGYFSRVNTEESLSLFGCRFTARFPISYTSVNYYDNGHIALPADRPGCSVGCVGYALVLDWRTLRRTLW